MGREIVDNANEEVGVFEIDQQPQVYQDATNKQHFPCTLFGAFVNGMADVIIENCRQQDEPNIPTTGFIKEIQGEKR